MQVRTSGARLSACILGAAVIGLGSQSFGAPILIKLGGNFNLTDPTNSPAHQAGAVSSSLTTWNYVGSQNSSSLATTSVTTSGSNYVLGSTITGFVDASGAATGLTMYLGVDSSTDASGTVNWSTATKAIVPPSTNGFQATGQIGGSLLLRNTSGNVAMALDIDGLSAGSYTLYLTASYSNSSTENFYVTTATGSQTGSIFQNLSVAGSATNASLATSSSSSNWIAGNTYAAINVNVSSGQDLYILSAGTVSIGNFSSLEIVPTPEPASIATVGTFASAFILRRRRRS